MEKVEQYRKAIAEMQERMNKVDGIIPRMATVAAVLKQTFDHFIWVGFYFAEDSEMIVGPYQGLAACPNISYEGVCGAAMKRKNTVIVPNVHKFPGHIVCDPNSNSEITVPLFDPDKHLIGVLDIDSENYEAFDEVDKKYLEMIIPILFEKE